MKKQKVMVGKHSTTTRKGHLEQDKGRNVEYKEEKRMARNHRTKLIQRDKKARQGY